MLFPTSGSRNYIWLTRSAVYTFMIELVLGLSLDRFDCILNHHHERAQGTGGVKAQS